MPVRNLKYLNTEMLNVLTIGWALIIEERMINSKEKAGMSRFYILFLYRVHKM